MKQLQILPPEKENNVCDEEHCAAKAVARVVMPVGGWDFNWYLCRTHARFASETLHDAVLDASIKPLRELGGNPPKPFRRIFPH